MPVYHGATYAALKVGEPVAARAASAERAAIIVCTIAYVAASIWVSGGLDGLRIVADADPSGTSKLAWNQVPARPAQRGRYCAAPLAQ